jgi:hypothetical protein
MEPLEILEARLSSLERDLAKSTLAYNEGGINLKMHETHVRNISPKIRIFKDAVSVLTDYYKNKPNG